MMKWFKERIEAMKKMAIGDMTKACYEKIKEAICKLIQKIKCALCKDKACAKGCKLKKKAKKKKK